MCENNHKSLIIQHFRELLGHLALFYLVIWRYFTWSFGVLLGIFVVNYFVFLRYFIQAIGRKIKIILHQLKKVDTEKIFQLNFFSKVDNSAVHL